MNNAALQASVTSAFAKEGFSMTLQRTSGGTYDPAAGETVSGVPQSWPVNGILANYGTQTRLAASNNPDSLIQNGDMMAKIEAGVVEPLPGDALVIGSDTWQVIAVDTLKPGGVALLHTLQIRK